MLWMKAFHIIAVICWFAGLFYLPRLFVYHAMAEDTVSRERFKVMERKLYRGIMTPSAIIAVFLGVGLMHMYPAIYLQPWMFIKLGLVAVLVIYHLYCGHIVKAFTEGQNSRSHVFYRWFNELPVVLLVAIVLLVVLKPS